MGGTARSSRISSNVGADGLVPACLLAGGALNGLTARVVDAWSGHGFALPLPGVGALDLLALAAAAGLVAGAPQGRGASLGWAEMITLVLLLVPSSTVSWIATAGYAAFLATRMTGGARAGAVLAFALALSALWAAHGLRALAVPITTAEAWLAAQVLGLVRGDIVQASNVVGVPGGHSLVILAACSALDGLPRVLLGAAAIALALGGWTVRRLASAGLACAALFLVLNQMRLVLMAWSAPLYDAAHGPAGANVFDLLQAGLALAGAAMAVRR